MRTLSQIETQSIALLSSLYGDNEARSMVRMLLEEYCSITNRDYVLEPNKLVDTTLERSFEYVPRKDADLHALSFDKAMDMCLSWRPIQYVMGHASFYDREFYVREGVLIPRPETEELVQMIISESSDAKSIVDIGTGSGCIALSLKANIEKARVDAVDISDKALEVVEINRSLHGLDVEILNLDILSEELPHKYDVIVSNPPYVLDSERRAMRDNVLNFEPELALFVDDTTPLLFYNRIAQLATKHLNHGGKLYFEINERFATETVEMLEGLGFVDVVPCRDMFNKFRMVKALWQNTTNM